MIEVEHLTKRFGEIEAVRDVSFRVEKGEILGFLGPNGAGKTTTMRIITGFMPATSGRVSVAGFDVSTQSLEVRRRLGYVPENVPIYTDMIVESYLDYVAALKGVAARERPKRVAQAIDSAGVASVAHRLIKHLSRGYRQRVCLAQAIVNDPDILILDEPTIGLDPKQIIEIRQLIKQMAQRRTVILSSHILPEVSMTCQRVVIINRGRVIAIDTPEGLTRQLQKSFRVELEVSGDKAAIEKCLRSQRGVDLVSAQGSADGAHRFVVESKSKDIRTALAAAVVGAGFGLLKLNPLTMSLEEIFVQLVTEEEATKGQ